MTKRTIGVAVAAFVAGILLVVGIAGGATGPTAWVLHVTSPSGDALNTTITVPTTTTSTTSSTTTTSTSTTTAPPGAGYPQITPPFAFDGDFDSGCQLLSGQGGDWSVDESGSDHPGTASIDRGNVGEGQCSAKFSTPAGSGSGRSEVQRGQVSTPVTVDYEFLMYVPSEANNGPDHAVLAQTKMGSNPCFNGGLTKPPGANLNFSTVGNCSAGSNKHDLGPVPFDRWFAVRVTATFADNGHATVWVDPDGMGPAGYGAPKLDVSTDTLSGSGLKLRQGLYHDQDPHESHVWGDGFHIAG